MWNLILSASIIIPLSVAILTYDIWGKRNRKDWPPKLVEGLIALLFVWTFVLTFIFTVSIDQKAKVQYRKEGYKQAIRDVARDREKYKIHISSKQDTAIIKK